MFAISELVVGRVVIVPPLENVCFSENVLAVSLLAKRDKSIVVILLSTYSLFATSVPVVGVIVVAPCWKSCLAVNWFASFFLA